MANDNEVQRLIDRYAKGQCTPEERALVEAAFLVDLKKSESNVSKEDLEDVSNRMLLAINEKILHEKKSSLRTIRMARLAVAACLLMFFSSALYYYHYGRTNEENEKVTILADAQPGGNKAYLTLANGKKILLDGRENGKVAEQAGIVVSKTKEGQLTYDAPESNGLSDSYSSTYNTIETPVGGQYHVVLPDRSKVWLNSASSIRFPISFAANSREVQITGEVYFEVEKDSNRPFLVTSGEQTVKVLGTHFNINAYQDDGFVRTTLLEGSIEVRLGTKSKILKPSQQAYISNKSDIDVLELNNANDAVAWKNGNFLFRNASIFVVISELERWYEVRFDSPDGLDYRFNGKVRRDLPLSEILKMIEITSGAKYKTEGRRVYMEK